MSQDHQWERVLFKGQLQIFALVEGGDLCVSRSAERVAKVGGRMGGGGGVQMAKQQPLVPKSTF